MEIQELCQKVRMYISKNQFEKTFSELHQALKNSPKIDEIILQESRYQDIATQIRQGIVSFDNSEMTKNKIRTALISFISELEEYSEEMHANTLSELETKLPQNLKIIKVTNNQKSKSGTNSINQTF